MSWGSSVVIVTMLQLDNLGLISGRDRNFSVWHTSSGVHPA